MQFVISLSFETFFSSKGKKNDGKYAAIFQLKYQNSCSVCKTKQDPLTYLLLLLLVSYFKSEFCLSKERQNKGRKGRSTHLLFIVPHKCNKCFFTSQQ